MKFGTWRTPPSVITHQYALSGDIGYESSERMNSDSAVPVGYKIWQVRLDHFDHGPKLRLESFKKLRCRENMANLTDFRSMCHQNL